MSLEPYVTEWTINPFPADTNNGRHWRLQVRQIADSVWAFHNNGSWLQPDMTWYPDTRNSYKLNDSGEALAVARVAVKTIEVNGVTWDDMVAKWGMP